MLELVVPSLFVDVGGASRPSYVLRVTARGARFATHGGDLVVSTRRVQCVTSQMSYGTAFEKRAQLTHPKRKPTIKSSRPPWSIPASASRRTTCRGWLGDDLQALTTRTLEAANNQAQ